MPDYIAIMLILGALLALSITFWMVRDAIRTEKTYNEIEHWLEEGEQHGKN